MKKIQKAELITIMEAVLAKLRETSDHNSKAITEWNYIEYRQSGDDLGTTFLKMSFYVDATNDMVCAQLAGIIGRDASECPLDDDYLTKDILYTGDHKCIPNGVGDYTFVCPTHGEKPGFVPFMFRSLLKGTCQCGEEIKLAD